MTKEREIKGQDLIFFPAEGRTISYFGELEKNPAERTRVLRRQHEWRQSHRGASSYATCECNRGKALFYVREDENRQGQRRYCLARFPRSSLLHDSKCFFYRHDVPRTREADGDAAKEIRRGDLVALFVSRGDPEEIRKAVTAPKGDSASSDHDGASATNASLRRLGTELLYRSGVCEWRPWFKDRRNCSRVDGLIAGAVQNLLSDAGNPYAQLLSNLGPDVLLGSWAHVTRQAGAGTVKKVLSFGFVTNFGPRSQSGSQVLTFFNRNTPPLVVPARVIAAATNNPRIVDIDCVVRHPLWAICIAEEFSGNWKAHKIALFRLTRTGLIPVESDNEEAMVEHLIASGRKFRRLLVQPEQGSEFVPDFALDDTSSIHYLEVAGMAGENYLKRLADKQVHWSGRMTIWHADQPLSLATLPIRTS